jgi:hypothetical protein
MKAKKGVVKLPPKLTKTQEDLLWHMQHGYQLETGSLQDGPLLRRLKDDKLIRTTSANQSTVEALHERGLIEVGKGGDVLTTVWRVRKK